MGATIAVASAKFHRANVIVSLFFHFFSLRGMRSPFPFLHAEYFNIRERVRQANQKSGLIVILQDATWER